MFKIWYKAEEEYVLVKSLESNNYIDNFDQEPSMESKDEDKVPSLKLIQDSYVRNAKSRQNSFGPNGANLIGTNSTYKFKTVKSPLRKILNN